MLASLAPAQNQFVCNVNVIPCSWCSWSRELSVLLLLIVAWLKDETKTFRSQRGKRKAAGKRDELGNTVGTRLQCEIIITVQIPTRVWPLSAKFRPECGHYLPNSDQSVVLAVCQTACPDAMAELWHSNSSLKIVCLKMSLRCG